MPQSTTMPLPAKNAAPAVFPGIVETWGADGLPGDGGTNPAGVVLICEHASNAFPVDCPVLGGTLGLEAQVRAAHVAWDIGALGLSRELARRLAPACGGAVLVHAPLSRLVFDLNRAPDHPGAMLERSEVFDIPGNRALTPEQRMARTQALYLPFHETLRSEIARLLARGRRPALIAVHSFTPVFHGARREVEFGVIHDDDLAFTDAIMDDAPACGLITRLNEPYSAAGAVTHTIRLHATPLRLQNTMLEIRNDLIATPQDQGAVADRLAPVLVHALNAIGSI